MSFLIASFVVATIAMTATKGSIFKAIRPKYKLFNCPYCLSHWIAAPYFFEFGLNFIGLIALSSIWSLLILVYLEKLDGTIHDSANSTL